MLRHPSVASASGTLLWHPALTSCYDILLRQAEGLRMERPPRQYNLGAGHFGASLFLLRLECAPFNSPLHPSKNSCSFTLFPSASSSPKVSPCSPHVYLLCGSGPCRLVEIAVHKDFATVRYHTSHFAISACLSSRSHTAVDGFPPDTPTTDSYTVPSNGYLVPLVPGA